MRKLSFSCLWIVFYYSSFLLPLNHTPISHQPSPIYMLTPKLELQIPWEWSTDDHKCLCNCVRHALSWWSFNISGGGANPLFWFKGFWLIWRRLNDIPQTQVMQTYHMLAWSHSVPGKPVQLVSLYATHCIL